MNREQLLTRVQRSFTTRRNTPKDTAPKSQGMEGAASPYYGAVDEDDKVDDQYDHDGDEQDV